MSVFTRTTMNCPACGGAVVFDLVHSVNAGRRPDLRVAILDRSFQRQPCLSCGTTFRVEPTFTYLDLPRKQFLGVWPASSLGEWKVHEQRTRAAFDKAFGPGSDGAPLAEGMTARCVFGWLGLNEKLIAHEHGIDDTELELAKLATMRVMGDVKLGRDREFRLVGASEEELIVGWLHTSSEEIDGEFSVPRQIISDIEAAPDTWAALRADVAGDTFVDYRRALV
jgi:hypothetical protein